MDGGRETIFKVLDLPIDSTPKTVRKKCQDLLLKYHPDKNFGQESVEYNKVGKFM
jgi:curved DNA-binding protein CbpA